MKKPAPEPQWLKTTWQVSPTLYRALKIRAAQEGREIRAVLASALEAYLDTPLPAAVGAGRRAG